MYLKGGGRLYFFSFMENIMCSIQKNLHIGIYGLIEQDDDILVIRKSRGPYKGLFDLPGGRPSHGEPILEALTREIKEETGIEGGNYSFFGNFSFLVSYKDSDDIQKELYHIALTYRVKNIEVKSFNPNIIDEDVNGSLWIKRHNLSKQESSPLLRSILESYEN
jgi:8-oxo-dGTP diphosphatase